MAEERAQRRLAAILAADVVGYSRLMQADEAGTLAGLKARRSQVLQPVVSKHRGRIVKLMGDGVLVEFASAVDAVDCAVQLQEAMGAANVGVPKDRQIVLRIGINLGDVMVEGSDLYGDGVNIAARLEALAEPGGVLVSNKVRSEVAAKLNVAFDDLGEQKLKNMTDPVRVYRVSGGAAASAPSPAPRSSKPSIAVLPFTNMSGDPEQEYFSDGITEDIITDLSKIGGLMVIARNSSFAYKGNATNIRVVARELGVRSVLEGSIRRAGGRVRITAQLIDGETGGHLWAERFDRELTDIFAVQDEVTRRIVDALKIALSPGEAAALATAETTNSKAHDLFLAGREFLFAPTRNRETFDRSTDLFAKAIVEDPSYGEPYAGAAFAQLLNWQNHWTNDWSRSLESAERSISLALQKSPQSAFVHYTAAVFFFWNKDLDRSAAEADAALDLNPNYANALSTRSLACIYGGQPLAAVPYIQQGFRLDPTTKHVYLHFLGSAYLLASDYRTAATVFRERIQLSPKTDLSRAFLAVALGHLGEVDEAQRVWRELMEINPKYSFTDHVGRLPFRDRADADRLAEGLSKAGISA